MNVLVFNAGSTSLKFGLYAMPAGAPLCAGSIDWANGDRGAAHLTFRTDGRDERSLVAVPEDATAASIAIQTVSQRHAIDAAGHRVVYGGTEFRDSLVVDTRVKAAIEAMSALAPLHNPPALAAIVAAESALPRCPQVAVFDTAFFANLSPRASLYALPHEWYERFGVRRIGFHGISNAYCATRTAELLGQKKPQGRVVTCHLGGGCSATGVLNGEPVATTMGFTPLEGLLMGTRSGSVDPGILLYLQRQCGLSPEVIEHGLTYQSGLLGLSGISADLAKIEAAAAQGNDQARLAFEIFADRVRGAIASLAATLGGLDTLVFTDRIGEGSPALRAAVCANLKFMGVELDAKRNAHCQADADVAAPGSAVRVLVLRTQEELMIARETARVLPATRA